ncbi:hypothetical protein HCH_03537 [Hahella chejuensis KCTC 2396]|uniref:Uncharacterized protein n=1 Tax=Hahella chejuensis (strain KCTC 2396) TaxID=349521 RepID=Q2SGE4_HAHCH|nr:hypothetical protein HCH_03537 [Hahella chejuensis KCTC 2396]
MAALSLLSNFVFMGVQFVGFGSQEFFILFYRTLQRL